MVCPTGIRHVPALFSHEINRYLIHQPTLANGADKGRICLQFEKKGGNVTIIWEQTSGNIIADRKEPFDLSTLFTVTNGIVVPPVAFTLINPMFQVVTPN